MAAEGVITRDEAAAAVLPAGLLFPCEHLEPFAGDGEDADIAAAWRVVASIPVPVDHPAWTRFQADGDAAALGADLALFFESVARPALEHAVVSVRGAGQGEKEVVDTLVARVAAGVQADPFGFCSLVHVLHLERM